MYVIAQQNAFHDTHIHFGTGLPNNFAQPQPDVALQNLEPVFRHPN
jgi:hypothetical protein